MIHTFTVPGKPVPKVRMTQKSKWGPRAKKCLEYQEKVAWHARAAKIPPLTGDVELTVRICQPDRGRADLDNIVKSIQDSLQYAGVIKNDRQVLRYGVGTGFWFGWRHPQVQVEIREIEEGEDGNP